MLVMRYANVDELIRVKLSSYLAKELKVGISIGNLDLTENLVTISKIHIHDNKNKYDVKIQKIYVRYNLLKFMYSGFQITKAIDQISVYEPDIHYIYSPNPLKTKAKTSIDLNRYFNRLTVYNGRLIINASDSIDEKTPAKWRINETFNNIQISIINKRKSNISIHASTANNASLTGKMSLVKGKLQDVDLSITNYQPQLVELDKIKQLKLNMSLLLSMHSNPQSNMSSKELPIIQLKAGIHQASADIAGHHIDVRNMSVFGSSNALQIRPTLATIDRSKVQLEGIIREPLSKSPTLVSNVNLQRLFLADLIPSVQGELTGKIRISGSTSDPKIELEGHSNTIVYQKQTFNSVDITALYAKKTLDFQLKDANWQDTQLQGQGKFIPGDSLNFNLVLSDMNHSTKLLKINGNLHGTVNVRNRNTAVKLVIDDITLRKDKYLLEHFHGNGSLKNQDVTLAIATANQQIQVEGSINLDRFDYQGKVAITQLPITQFLPEKFTAGQVPLLDGIIIAEGNRSELSTNISLHALEDSRKLYDIQLNTSLAVNLKKKTVFMELEGLKGQYNQVPINLTLTSTGDYNSLETNDLKLNDSIDAKGWIQWKPGLKYGLSIQGDSIQLSNYLTYFAPFGKKSPYSGSVTLDMSYNLLGDNKITGTISLDSVNVNPNLYALNTKLILSGTTDKIQIDSLIVGNIKSLILTGNGSLVTDNTLALNIHMQQYNISDITPKDDFSGLVNADISLNMDLQGKANQIAQKPLLQVSVQARNCVYGSLTADSLLVKFTQYPDYLEIDTLNAYSSQATTIHGQGSIGYNFFNGKQITDNRVVNLTADTDLINLVELLSNRFIQGHGKGNITLSIGMEDEGLSVKQGSIMISNGSFKVKSQSESVSKVQINALIKDNRLELKRCRFYMGKGYLNIRSEIKNDENDFHIAMLNLGQFYLKTSSEGIPVTVPDYSQPNTTVDAVIKGQYSEEAIITGPWDDMHIEAEVEMSNGYGLYPSNTANLLQLINTAKEPKSVVVADPLPFTMNVILRFKNNMRYITYPTNFLITSDSYFRLVYDGTMFSVPEALFMSEQGTLDMFGTTFEVDYLEMTVTALSTKLKGTFYKKASDGSLITLNVSQLSDNDTNFFHNLKLTLMSDSPLDKTNTQILAKLRYNRPLEDLSRSQQQAMLQDEAIQLVGVNIGSSFIDPYLSPYESKIRKFLHVDFFNISPGFITNVVNEYVINNASNPNLPVQNSYQPDQSNFMNIGSNILLNNLSVNMGKYVFRSIFVDYTALLQETTNLSKATKLVVYHNATLRVSLPWYLKLAYTFQIRPGDAVYSHEIFIQRSFRF